MADFFAASRVLVVAGKGGVGKTTLGAILGVAAARSGLDVEVVEIAGLGDPDSGGAQGLGPLLDERPLTVESRLMPEVGPGRLSAVRLDAGAVLAEYLAGHGLDRVGDRLAGRGTIDVLTTAAPGIKDLLILGKIRKQADERDDLDLIIVDGPAAGHALSFLRSPRGFITGTSGSGPVREQARLAATFLADPDRCQILLVTTAEATPVSETIDAAFDLEDDLGIALAPLVVNGLWTEIEGLAKATDEAPPGPLRDAGEYRLRRLAAQAEQCRRLADELPLQRIPVDQRFTDRLTPIDIGEMADQVLTSLGAM